MNVYTSESINSVALTQEQIRYTPPALIYNRCHSAPLERREARLERREAYETEQQVESEASEQSKLALPRQTRVPQPAQGQQSEHEARQHATEQLCTTPLALGVFVRVCCGHLTVFGREFVLDPVLFELQQCVASRRGAVRAELSLHELSAHCLHLGLAEPHGAQSIEAAQQLFVVRWCSSSSSSVECLAHCAVQDGVVRDARLLQAVLIEQHAA